MYIYMYIYQNWNNIYNADINELGEITKKFFMENLISRDYKGVKNG